MNANTARCHELHLQSQKSTSDFTKKLRWPIYFLWCKFVLYIQSLYYSLRTFDWHLNQWPWITLEATGAVAELLVNFSFIRLLFCDVVSGCIGCYLSSAYRIVWFRSALQCFIQALWCKTPDLRWHPSLTPKHTPGPSVMVTSSINARIRVTLRWPYISLRRVANRVPVASQYLSNYALQISAH